MGVSRIFSLFSLITLAIRFFLHAGDNFAVPFRLWLSAYEWWWDEMWLCVAVHTTYREKKRQIPSSQHSCNASFNKSISGIKYINLLYEARCISLSDSRDPWICSEQQQLCCCWCRPRSQLRVCVPAKIEMLLHLKTKNLEKKISCDVWIF